MFDFSGEGHFVDQEVRVLIPGPSFEHFVLLNVLVTYDEHFTSVLVFLPPLEVDTESHVFLSSLPTGVVVSDFIEKFIFENVNVSGVVVHLDRNEAAIVFELAELVECAIPTQPYRQAALEGVLRRVARIEQDSIRSCQGRQSSVELAR